METRRVLIAILLCTLFWLAYSALQPALLPVPPASPPGESGGGPGVAGTGQPGAGGAPAAGGTTAGKGAEAGSGDAAHPAGAGAGSPSAKGLPASGEAGGGQGGSGSSNASPGAPSAGQGSGAGPAGGAPWPREVLHRLPPTTAAATAWLRDVQERQNSLETVTLENDWVRLEFVLPDATIERAWLKHYTREVVRDERERADPTRWVSVIEPGTIGPRPLLVRDFFETEASPLNNLTWTLTERQPGRSIRFEAPLPDGGLLWKEVRLPAGLGGDDGRWEGAEPSAGVEVFLGLRAGQQGAARRRALFTLGASVYEETGRFYRGPTAVVRRTDGRRESSSAYTLNHFKEGITSKQDGEEGIYRNLWFALSSQYFSIAARPLDPGEGGGDGGSSVPASLGVARTEPLFSVGKLATALADLQGRQGGGHDPNGDWKALLSKARKNLALSCEVRLDAPAAGASVSRGFFVYLGPKDPKLLAQEPYRVFQPVIDQDYGSYLGPVVKLLVGLLRFFQWLTGNYGAAILLLTIAVRILIFPMSYKQQKAMARFQEAQQKLKPKIDELKTRFKNKPKKLREEQMRLMKSEGVSFPLAGCLTLFLQMPIFIGLFQTLRVAFELRQQPFLGWILDLSRPDAFLELPFTLPILGSSELNILPVFMTVVWIVQMRMQPLPPDPQQAQSQKMMRFMPFLFGFFFYNYASGLSLYMLMNFLLGIGETKFLKPWLQRRTGDGASSAAAAPAPGAAGRSAAKLPAASRQPVLPKKRR